MTDEVVKTQEQLIVEATDQDLGLWRNDPTTKRFLAYLKAYRALDAEEFLKGAYSSKSVEETALLQAEVIGRAQFIEELLELKAIDLLTTERDIADAKYFRL